MIHESYYWKQPLLESSEKFKAFKELSDIDEETYVKIEKDIFIGFYSIRKLIETETKVTDDLKFGKHNISWFEHVGDDVTWRNNHRYPRLKPGHLFAYGEQRYSLPLQLHAELI